MPRHDNESTSVSATSTTDAPVDPSSASPSALPSELAAGRRRMSTGISVAAVIVLLGALATLMLAGSCSPGSGPSQPKPNMPQPAT